MAQYFEVLSQSDGNVEQSAQFFNGSPEGEQTQVRYILADESQQFQTQQLVQLTTDQVMVVDSQQQLQQVVIDQGQITYQQSPNQQQYSAVVQNANVNVGNQTHQVYYMETNGGSSVDNVQTVQTVIEQAPVIQQNTQRSPTPQPIVLNHHLGSNSPNLSTTRQVIPGTPQRPVLQIRTAVRQNHIQVTSQTRPGLPTARHGLPQQVRPHQASPLQPQVRSMTPQQLQMRMRAPTSQNRQPGVQQIPQQRTVINAQQKNQRLSMINRQLNAMQQASQIVPQHPPAAQQIANQIHKSISEFQQQQQQQQQQQINNNEQSAQVVPQQPQSTPVGKPVLKQLSDFQALQNPGEDVDELDDHDPTMNSTPGQMVTYKKLLDQRQHIGKNSILSRLPNQIKVTQSSNPVNQQQSQQPVGVQQPQQQQQSQVNQTPQMVPVQTAPKKPKAPPRPKNPTTTPRASPVGVPNRPRIQRAPVQVGPQQLPRIIGPQPRFPLNQQHPRFPNQQQIMQQRMQQQQSNQTQQQVEQQLQQNGQSQMNYLITPPTANRPRQQRPLPAYIPSSQIQQIIESTPIAEEFSDSIRMLVLLENGEQRLITFTLPKEACTIQEILEQVNVPFTQDTNIQVTEANTNGINYIVTVGNVSNFAVASVSEDDSQEMTDPEHPHSQPSTPVTSNQQKTPLGQQTAQQPPESARLPSPEPPKLVPGKLAVCSYCGYTGEDFNKCRRCMRKLPDNVRSIDSPLKAVNMQKVLDAKSPAINITPGPLAIKSLPATPASKPSTPTKKKASKPKPVEHHESVVISSDEEEDEKKTVRSVSEQLLKSLGASVTISPITKEPTLSDIKKHVRKLTYDGSKIIKMGIKCRTVRIGSYRFVPLDEVIIDSKCVIIKAPVVDSKTEVKTVRIDRGDIVKVLASFNKALPVVFLYLNVAAAPGIRDLLNLKKESGLYFDPLEEKEDSIRKITLLPEDFEEDHKTYFQQIYSAPPYNIMDELTAKEANEILIKSCPKDGSAAANFGGAFDEIQEILLYPKKGQGRLNLNTEDWVCLGADQFLNDKIIDFYLKYLWNNLPAEQQEKVHIFSTFFYKRLTTKPPKATKKLIPFEVDPTLSASEKRHCRVKSWTKRVNLFEKDFVVVPINENAHWFLAIVCFPGMKGPQTFDGKPYKPEPKQPRKKKAPVKKEKPIPCDEPVLSDKDEAESEDSDMESDDSEEAAAAAAAAAESAAAIAAAAAAVVPPVKVKREPAAPRPPIKQPCILIFDSLAGPSRARVVATLRDYLTVEYKTKMEIERVFNRDVIKGASLKVPQQNNFTDCGLYLLQYVEQFFQDPLRDFSIPIKGLEHWFEEIIVTKKREDIANLIKQLMEEAGNDIKLLPEITLPTLNGAVVERPEQEHESPEEEQEDMFTDIEDAEMTDASANCSHQSEENGDEKSEENQDNSSEGNSSQEFSQSPMKPSSESVSDQHDIVTTVMPTGELKPTLSEFPRQTNKDTLNYLKAKRIVRHKPADGPELKKTKTDMN